MAVRKSGTSAEVRAAATNVKKLSSLVEASKVLNSTLDLNELLTIILDLAVKNLHAERGTIYLIDRNTNELTAKVRKGKEPVEIRLPMGKGIAGHVAKTGKTVIIKDAHRDSRFFKGFDQKTGFITKTMLCMPLRNRNNKTIGVFQILNKRRGLFTLSDRQFLNAFSIHAALAIENAQMHRLMLEKKSMEKEMEIAGAIQQQLFPRELPSIPSYAFHAKVDPCKSIGGDYYCITPIGKERVLMAIADVSGKGVPASLLVSSLHAFLQSYLSQEIALDILMSKLNTMIHKNSPSDSFITCFIGVINTTDHRLSYVNAGHPLPYIVDMSNGAVTTLKEGGIPLGMLPEWEYRAETLEIRPNHSLVCFTDGLSEAVNSGGDMFGEERIKSTLESIQNTSKPTILDVLSREVRNFIGKEPMADDLTVLSMTRLS